MFYLLRFIIDILYVIAIYFGYRLGIQIGMKYLFTDMYIARLYCGFIGIAVVVFLFSKIKGTIIFFLKAIGLYAIATNTTGVDAFKNVMKRFDKVLCIAVVTNLITDAVNDVKQAMTDQDTAATVTQVFPVLADLPFSSVINVIGKYYAKSFTYLDECILAYSFAVDKPIIPSLKDAFLQFLKKSYKIIGQLIMSNIIVTILNIVIFVVGIIFYLQKFKITLHSIIMFYIVVRVVMYAIDDAFLQPLLLKNVIIEYIQGIPSAADEFEENFSNLTESTDGSTTEKTNNVDDAQESDGQSTDSDSSEAGPVSLESLLALPAVKKLMSLTDLTNSKQKSSTAKKAEGDEENDE